MKIVPNDNRVAYQLELLSSAVGLVPGRMTYEGFAGTRPAMTGDFADTFNSLPKHVASTTLTGTTWNAEVLPGNSYTDDAIRDMIYVEICGGYGIRFANENSSPAPGSGHSIRTGGPLARDGSMRWPLSMDENHSEDVEIKLICIGARGEGWRLTELAHVPQTEPKLEFKIKPDNSIPRRLIAKLMSPTPISGVNLAVNGANFLRCGQAPNIRAGARSSPILGQHEQPQRVRVGNLLQGQTASVPVEWTPGSMFFTLNVSAVDVSGRLWEWRETVHIPSWLQWY